MSHCCNTCHGTDDQDRAAGSGAVGDEFPDEAVRQMLCQTVYAIVTATGATLSTIALRKPIGTTITSQRPNMNPAREVRGLLAVSISRAKA